MSIPDGEFKALQKKVNDLELNAIDRSNLSDLEARLLDVIYLIADKLEIPRSDLDFRRGPY